ncbi:MULTISPECIES: GIY-YIG nuclease family protein [unclassified Mesorhizobium]|uniref:GIY-YIG nuclease family protein n=1 Tax=unclassified Mesorhizobium TaxID=325217 RepID=UPI001FED6260|nr:MULTISPECIES: GIY-YIG nuclease family protein [unclassified Mesorhizobium]
MHAQRCSLPFRQLCHQKRGTIYIGVTNDLGRRMPEHKSGNGSRFTSRYCSGPQEHCRKVTAWIPGSRRVASLLASPWDDEVEGCFG